MSGVGDAIVCWSFYNETEQNVYTRTFRSGKWDAPEKMASGLGNDPVAWVAILKRR
jgi:hypothetical protein